MLEKARFKIIQPSMGLEMASAMTVKSGGSSVLDKYKLAYRMNEEIGSMSSETLVRTYHTSRCHI